MQLVVSKYVHFNVKWQEGRQSRARQHAEQTIRHRATNGIVEGRTWLNTGKNRRLITKQGREHGKMNWKRTGGELRS